MAGPSDRKPKNALLRLVQESEESTGDLARARATFASRANQVADRLEKWLRERANERRVLIVEDEPTVAKTIMHLVQRELRLEVKIVHSGAEAREALAASEFDLLLVDVLMPDESGPELVWAIKNTPGVAKRPMAPAVLISGLVGDHTLNRAAEKCGAIAVLRKPIDYNELMAVVQRFIPGMAQAQASRTARSWPPGR